MTTLIAIYGSEGCDGRCDARCYDAKNHNCNCVCGGRNHGVGLEKAAENTREMVDQWVEDYAKTKGLENYRVRINRELVDQHQLFDIANFSTRID